MVVQVCFPMHLYGKKHLKILVSKTEDALWLNLCIYYWEHLHVCSGYVTQVNEPWPVGLLLTELSAGDMIMAGYYRFVFFRFVHLCFHIDMWRLCCRYLFLIFPFGSLAGLCFKLWHCLGIMTYIFYLALNI